MGKVWSALPLTLLISLLFSASAIAGQVYLTDGAIVEAQKVWQSKGKIHVLVNRDVLLSFTQEEVDIKRTFGKQKPGTRLKARASAVRPATSTTAEPVAPAVAEGRKR
jgi:hypothetical protein